MMDTLNSNTEYDERNDESQQNQNLNWDLNEDISFDIQNIQIAKRRNYVKAFETNLRGKKDEIIALEKHFDQLQKE